MELLFVLNFKYPNLSNLAIYKDHLYILQQYYKETILNPLIHYQYLQQDF